VKLNGFVMGLVVGMALACATGARGESAKKAFADAEAILATGDLHGALRAYETAVRADRSNQEYVQKFKLVRGVILRQQILEKEENPERWRQTAQALHAFYIGEGLLERALEIDRTIHGRLNTAYSAAQLAETQLALDLDAEAADVLAALGPQKTTSSTRALLAIALARQGKRKEAKRIADTVSLDDKAGPGSLYGSARMHAVVGSHQRALSLMTRSFEAVLPSQLGALKAHAKQCPEFAGLVSLAGFTKALKTESKVAESKCSGGSSCAGCPMRASCSKDEGK
jgi:tetratricopeptide (TPR) repeat protein